MSNTLNPISNDLVYFGNELLFHLKNLLVITGIVNTNFRGGVGEVGETIKVPFLNVAGSSRTRTKYGPVVVDDIGSGQVPVTLQHIYKSLKFDNLDMTLSNVIDRATLAQRLAYGLVEGVDASIMGLWNEIPYEVGDLDGTAAFDATNKLNHLSSARKTLMVNKSPMDNLQGLLGPTEAHNYRTLDINIKSNEAGTDAIRGEGFLGRVYGINLRETQQVASSTLTPTASWGTPLIDLVAGYAIGTTTIHVDGVGSGLTIKKGSTFSLGGNSYVVTADAAATLTDVDLPIYPALKTAVANDDPLTPIAHSAASSENLIFNPRGIGLAIRPMAQMMAGSGPLQTTVTDPQTGLTLRLSIESRVGGDANVAFSEQMTVDMLAGVKVLQPEMCVRLLGQV